MADVIVNEFTSDNFQSRRVADYITRAASISVIDVTNLPDVIRILELAIKRIRPRGSVTSIKVDPSGDPQNLAKSITGMKSALNLVFSNCARGFIVGLLAACPKTIHVHLGIADPDLLCFIEHIGCVELRDYGEPAAVVGLRLTPAARKKIVAYAEGDKTALVWVLNAEFRAQVDKLRAAEFHRLDAPDLDNE